MADGLTLEGVLQMTSNAVDTLRERITLIIQDNKALNQRMEPIEGALNQLAAGQQDIDRIPAMLDALKAQQSRIAALELQIRDQQNDIRQLGLGMPKFKIRYTTADSSEPKELPKLFYSKQAAQQYLETAGVGMGIIQASLVNG